MKIADVTHCLCCGIGITFVGGKEQGLILQLFEMGGKKFEVKKNGLVKSSIAGSIRGTHSYVCSLY